MDGPTPISESLREVLDSLDPVSAEKLALAIYGARRRHPSLVHLPGVGLVRVG
jgi:hypothetical protein